MTGCYGAASSSLHSVYPMYERVAKNYCTSDPTPEVIVYVSEENK